MFSKLLFATLFFLAGTFGLAAIAQAEPATGGSQTLEYSPSSDAPEYTTVQAWTRVCCKRGGRDWWTTQRACRQSGGYRVADRQCRNDRNEARVCCKRGRYDWWTTRRACARSGGYRVAAWQCRNG